MSNFNERYYRDKFNQKRVSLYNQQQKDPNNQIINEKIKFINKILDEKNRSKWPDYWKQYERDELYWVEKDIDKNKEK